MNWFKRKFRKVKRGVVKAGDTIADTGKKAGDAIVDTGKKAGDAIVDTGKKVEEEINDLIDKAGLDPVGYAKFVKANAELLASPNHQKKLVEQAAMYAREYEDFLVDVSGMVKDYISHNTISVTHRKGLPGASDSYRNQFFQANQVRLQAANEKKGRFFKSFSTGAIGGVDLIVGGGGGFGGYSSFDKNDDRKYDEIRYGSIQGSGGIALGANIGFEVGFWKDPVRSMRSGVFRGATTDVIYLYGVSIAVIFDEDLNNLEFQGFSIAGALGIGAGVSSLTGYEWVNF